MSAEHDRRKNNGLSQSDTVKGFSRERPWLLPSNRKLRHLQGIYVRNLDLSGIRTRRRAKTIDDESLPYSLNTPAKILAQREANKLEHSKSSDDLKSSSLKANGGPKEDTSENESKAKARPMIRKIRRRSTLNWTNAPPKVRQSKLEDITRERMADTWFTLHCTGVETPIYVSETIEKAMNPSFRFFDLNVYRPAVTRLDELTIKYWARTENMQDYILLVELKLSLRSLQFIGKSLESFHHPLPPNCILLHLSDGIYTSFTDLPLDEPVLTSSRLSKQPNGLQPTSSFDALMRLSNLDDCIQDALATRGKLTSQIEKLLHEQKQSLDSVNAASQAEERLAATNRAVTTARKHLRTAQNRRSALQASLQTRRAAIVSGGSPKDEAQYTPALAEPNVSSRRSLSDSTKSDLTGQIRRVCEDLSSIYPIEPLKNKPLSFTIGGLYLPNAASISASDTDPAATAAALGHVAHIVHLLSLYLLTPIPYPPSPHGSTSTILDPISTSMPSLAARTFPLYQKGAVTYRFEYGVFLLNSDIELLMSKQGSRMVDIRHTLPNLKYLLTVLTSGKGELPLRKKDDSNTVGNGFPIEERRTSSPAEKVDNGVHLNGTLKGKAMLKPERT